MNEKDPKRYDDLLPLTRPESGKHKKMTNLERAAQFAPFAALSGFGKMIRETAERETAGYLLTVQREKNNDIRNRST